jgi:hypothetical protein
MRKKLKPYVLAKEFSEVFYMSIRKAVVYWKRWFYRDEFIFCATRK